MREGRSRCVVAMPTATPLGSRAATVDAQRNPCQRAVAFAHTYARSAHSIDVRFGDGKARPSTHREAPDVGNITVRERRTARR
jgi:hypothetical protein